MNAPRPNPPVPDPLPSPPSSSLPRVVKEVNAASRALNQPIFLFSALDQPRNTPVMVDTGNSVCRVRLTRLRGMSNLAVMKKFFGGDDAPTCYAKGARPFGDPDHWIIVTRDGAGKYEQQPVETVRSRGLCLRDIQTVGPAETVVINGRETAKSWEQAIDWCIQQREARALGDP